VFTRCCRDCCNLYFLSSESAFLGGDRDPPFRLVLRGGDRDRLRLLLGDLRPPRPPLLLGGDLERLTLGDLRLRFLFDLLLLRRLLLLLLLPLLLRDEADDDDPLEELLSLRYLFRSRERLPASFLRLLPLGGDRLRLRLRDDDRDLLLAGLRSPRLFSFGDSFFEDFFLGGDLDRSWLRLLLPPKLLFDRLPSFPLPLGGDLLEDRRGDLLGERLLSFPLPLGGDLLLEDRRGDLLGERLPCLPLPLGGDLLLEDRRGDVLGERLICLPLPLGGDLLADLRWSRSCLEEMTFGGDRDRSRLL